MQSPAAPTAETDQGDTETWPWRCLDCGGTIYHDVELCRDCDASSRSATDGREADAPTGFVDWMREQPAATFVLKVTALAGVELSLTTVWLEAVLRRSLELASVMPNLAS